MSKENVSTIGLATRPAVSTTREDGVGLSDTHTELIQAVMAAALHRIIDELNRLGGSYEAIMAGRHICNVLNGGEYLKDDSWGQEFNKYVQKHCRPSWDFADTQPSNVAPGSSTNPVAPPVGTADQRDDAKPKANSTHPEQEERS